MSYMEHDNLQDSPVPMDGETLPEAGEAILPAMMGGEQSPGAVDIGIGENGGGETQAEEMFSPQAAGEGEQESGGPSVDDDAAGQPDTAPPAEEEKPKRKRAARKKSSELGPEDGPAEQPPAPGADDFHASSEAEMDDIGVAAADDGPSPDGGPGDEQNRETAGFTLEAGDSPDLIDTEDELGGGDAEYPDKAPEELPPEQVPAAPRRSRRPSSAARTTAAPKKQLSSKPLDSKPSLLSLDLNKLDHELTEEERDEWNAIYASYRSKSILTGRIVGIDTHAFNVRNRETGRTERRKLLCAVIIGYRVKVLIPESEVWMPGLERPPHVLRNMTGAEIDYTILDVDREGSVAIGSRRMAAVARRHFFDTVKGGHKLGERLSCRVLAVGPKRCLVECGGRDINLSQKDLTYTATPDLRERYHPGQTLDCILKEYDRGSGLLWISVKDTAANPFLGAIKRHPIGSRRQATISGKYGGGVFCTLPDETVCLCLYSTRHSDGDFKIGDTVILVIRQFDYDRSLIYGRILSKW